MDHDNDVAFHVLGSGNGYPHAQDSAGGEFLVSWILSLIIWALEFLISYSFSSSWQHCRHRCYTLSGHIHNYHFPHHMKPRCSHHHRSQDYHRYSKTHRIRRGRILSPYNTPHLDIVRHKSRIHQSDNLVDNVTDAAHGCGSDQVRETLVRAKGEVHDHTDVGALIHIHDVDAIVHIRDVVSLTRIHAAVIHGRIHEFDGMLDDHIEVRYVVREPYGHELRGDLDVLCGLNGYAVVDVYQYGRTCPLYNHLTIADDHSLRGSSWFFNHQL